MMMPLPGVSSKGRILPGRDAAKALVEKLGGRTSSSITKSTSYLVSDGKSDGSKAAKARDYGIKVITEAEFLQMVKVADSTTQTLESPAQPIQSQPTSTQTQLELGL